MNQSEPLTESYFYILLCLYREPMHGYGIMQETLKLSDGRVKIGSGTMYGATGNMMRKGWIEEIKATSIEEAKKRMYQLTLAGEEILQGEIVRLTELLDAVKIVKAATAK